MAEGLARAAGAEAYSAGTKPAGFVHPLVVQVMAEIGIDISAQKLKPLDVGLAQTMDAVITVCDDAEEMCPVIFGVRRLHWPILDPLESIGTWDEALSWFRRVRDNMAWRVNELLKDLRRAQNDERASDLSDGPWRDALPRSIGRRDHRRRHAHQAGKEADPGPGPNLR